jgi:hypothetical protein
MVPTFTVIRSTGEAPGFTPAVSPRLRRRPSPWPPSPGFRDPARSSPPPSGSGYAPRTSPDPPGSSWRLVKRRNNTDSSRIPSRLAHRARPIRQCWTDATLSRLLPPSPATPGSGFLQLHPTATAAGRWRSFTSIRTNSASWRTENRARTRTKRPLTQDAAWRHRHDRQRRVTPKINLKPHDSSGHCPCTSRVGCQTRPLALICTLVHRTGAAFIMI